MRVSGHEVHLLTGGYALDMLTDGERADFERHLRDCPGCAEEVRGMQETAARLARATAVVPPPELRERVLAAVPRTRQLPPRGRDLRVPGRRLPLGRAGIGATVLTLAAAVVFLLVLQVSTSHQLRQQQAAGRSVAAVLAAPDARSQSLPATGGGTVTAVTSLHQGESVVTASGLPDLSGSWVYQLWVMTAGGNARSAGLIALSAGSTQPLVADGVAAGDELGITVEPAGGTAQPTTTPVIMMPA